MSRPGITYQEVANTAIQLQGQLEGQLKQTEKLLLVRSNKVAEQ